jgi:hypothetical protein
VSSTNYWAPYHAVFSSLLSLHPSWVQIFPSAPCSEHPQSVLFSQLQFGKCHTTHNWGSKGLVKWHNPVCREGNGISMIYSLLWWIYAHIYTFKCYRTHVNESTSLKCLPSCTHNLNLFTVPKHKTMKAYRGSGGTAPCILNLNTSQRCQLHAPATLPPGTHRVGDRLDAVAKANYLTLSRIKLGRPIRSQLLYRLSYPGGLGFDFRSDVTLFTSRTVCFRKGTDESNTNSSD